MARRVELTVICYYHCIHTQAKSNNDSYTSNGLEIMKHRINEFSTFVRFFIHHLLVLREVVLGLLGLIVLGAFGISVVEEPDFSESLYFSFITALSIGYGDITPVSMLGRAISVGIGFVDMVFVGLSVAIATRALADTIKKLEEFAK